jgi:hypothetical protein
MTLGEILTELGDEARVHRLAPALGDPQWQARAASAANDRGLALGEYARAAVERFAAMAGDEDWLALLSALNRGTDPGVICLRRIVDWAMQRDGVGDVR